MEVGHSPDDDVTISKSCRELKFPSDRRDVHPYSVQSRSTNIARLEGRNCWLCQIETAGHLLLSNTRRLPNFLQRVRSFLISHSRDMLSDNLIPWSSLRFDIMPRRDTNVIHTYLPFGATSYRKANLLVEYSPCTTAANCSLYHQPPTESPAAEDRMRTGYESHSYPSTLVVTLSCCDAESL